MSYQRVILFGVPFWKLGDVIYAYEPSPTPETVIRLGTTTELDRDWATIYAQKLQDYRTAAASRPRAKN